MTTSVQKKDTPAVITIIGQMKNEIARALPKHMTPDRMLRIALTEVRKNPGLLSCDPHSFAGALVQCSQLGLEPGSGLGHAYLIPFKNRKLNITECQFIVGYKGYIDLARRSGQVSAVWATPVFEGDSFDWIEGTDRRIDHKPTGCWDPDKLTAVYAVVKYKDGSTDYEVLTRDRIDRIRSMKQYNNVWDDHYIEMARKTAIRALAKRLPLSPEMASAIEADDSSDKESQENWLAIDAEYEPKPTEPDPEKAKAIINETAKVEKPDAVKRYDKAKAAEYIAAFDAAEQSLIERGGNPESVLGSAYSRIKSAQNPSDLVAATEILNGWSQK